MGESILDIIFRTKKTGDGDKQAQSGLKGLNDAFENVTGVSLTTAGAFAAVGAALKYSVDSAAEAEQIQKQLETVIKSTGGAAGMTADDIGDMAGELSDLTAVEDDTIAKASAVMLTFTKIGEEVFPDAMESALNLSAALKQDLQSSVLQVGKAMNDFDGYTALKRTGVSFTEEQEKQIENFKKTNDLVGYQKLVLSELNTEFGGQAAAAASTYAGQLEILKNNVGGLAEAFGGELLPPLNAAITEMNRLIKYSKDHYSVIGDENEALSATAQTYEEYAQGLTTALEAQNLMVKQEEDGLHVYTVIGQTITDVTDRYNVLSQTQWAGVQAARDWGNDQREAGLAAQYSGEQAQGLAQTVGDVEQAEKEAKQAAEDYEDAERRLADSFKDLEKAQKGWAKGAGEDVKAALEDGWMAADKYDAAIKAIDETYGTTFESQQNYQEDIKSIKEEYNRTGDIDTFKRKLGELREEYMKNDERVIEAKNKVIEFKGALDSLPMTKEILIHIRAAVDILNGGDGDLDPPRPACFIGSTLVNTPKGLRKIAEIVSGDLVQLYTEAEELISVQVRAVKVGCRDDLKQVRLSDGRRFVCSPEHPWKVREGRNTRWVQAGCLLRDMELVTIRGAVFVHSVIDYPCSAPVYDLHVAHPDHTFLVDGIVVHNKEADFASGGFAYPGDVVTVGEYGPERMVMPPAGGPAYVIPNGQGSGAAVEFSGPVYINNGMDFEELMYRVEQRLMGRN